MNKEIREIARDELVKILTRYGKLTVDYGYSDPLLTLLKMLEEEPVNKD